MARASIRLPDGALVERSLVRHPGAVALVAVDEAGRWLLVRQYRIGVGGVLLEIPAGTRDAGEAPEVTAQRELREETGFAAASLELLGGTWMVPGYCDEYITAYLARDLVHDPLQADYDEDIEVERVAPDRAVAMIMSGEIEDAKSISSILTAIRVLRS